jgi:hypothetical protein
VAPPPLAAVRINPPIFISPRNKKLNKRYQKTHFFRPISFYRVVKISSGYLLPSLDLVCRLSLSHSCRWNGSATIFFSVRLSLSRTPTILGHSQRDKNSSIYKIDVFLLVDWSGIFELGWDRFEANLINLLVEENFGIWDFGGFSRFDSWSWGTVMPDADSKRNHTLVDLFGTNGTCKFLPQTNKLCEALDRTSSTLLSLPLITSLLVTKYHQYKLSIII